MPALQINYLVVVVAALAAFLLGALWYSPLLFARAWVAAHGYTPEEVAGLRARAGGAYAAAALCHLITALVIAVLAYYLHLVRVAGGLKLGAMLWLGFAFTIGLTGVLFSRRRFAVFLIDAGYQLAYLLLMGAIIAGWQ